MVHWKAKTFGSKLQRRGISELERKDQHKENPLPNTPPAKNTATLFLSIGFGFSSCFTAAIPIHGRNFRKFRNSLSGGNLP